MSLINIPVPSKMLNWQKLARKFLDVVYICIMLDIFKDEDVCRKIYEPKRVLSYTLMIN